LPSVPEYAAALCLGIENTIIFPFLSIHKRQWTPIRKVLFHYIIDSLSPCLLAFINPSVKLFAKVTFCATHDGFIFP